MTNANITESLDELIEAVVNTAILLDDLRVAEYQKEINELKASLARPTKETNQ